jgi:hypothetical protein
MSRARQGERDLSDKPTEAAAQGPPQSGSGTAAPPIPTTPVAQTIHEAEASWWSGVWPRIKEHKIAQWTIAYAAFAFVALHAATLASDALEWPHAVVRTVMLVLILGLTIMACPTPKCRTRQDRNSEPTGGEQPEARAHGDRIQPSGALHRRTAVCKYERGSQGGLLL